MKIKLLLVLVIFLSIITNAQKTKIDSVLADIQSGKVDTNTIKELNNIGLHYEFANRDTSKYFIQKALFLSQGLSYTLGIINCNVYLGWLEEDISNYDEAIKYYETALVIAQEEKITKKIAVVNNSLGTANRLLGNNTEAIDFYNKNIKIQKETNDSIGLAKSYSNIGLVYYEQNKYADALDNYQKSIIIKEKLGDKQGIANTLNLIGNIYRVQDNYIKALEYYNRALETRKEISDVRGVVELYLNIGAVYQDKEEYDKAINFFKKGLEICVKNNAIKQAANFYNNIGVIYGRQKKYEKALEYFEKALEIKIILKDEDGIATAYDNLSSWSLKLGKYNDAVSYSEKSLVIANKLDNILRYLKTYESLSVAYDSLGYTRKALDYYRLYISYKDTLDERSSSERLSNLQTQYETAEKERRIEILTQEQKLQDLEMDRQSLFRNFLIAGILFVLVLVILVLKNSKARQKANKILSKQNHEISLQKDIIEEKSNDIMESIQYAKRIQTSILPSKKILKDIFDDFLVLFKPKDEVSGDFYWWAKIGNKTIITAADCTGHGVPGAFMSMLGISALNEIVIKEYVLQPHKILNELRKNIIKVLKQRGISGEQKDGMDMSIVSINHETNIVEFSGANNPLYIITEKNLQGFENLGGLTEENSFKLFYEIKPDKMPISIYEKMDKFTLHEIQLQKGDQIYMFSDGYADQFGGPKGKKFKYKPFKRMLLENADKPMAEQKEILNTAFEQWQGDLEQIDDVVIVGVKI